MPNYTLEIKASAQKELDALEHAVFARIDRRILALAGNPWPEGCKKLKSYNALCRIRAGDWRVVYSIDDSAAITLAFRRLRTLKSKE